MTLLRYTLLFCLVCHTCASAREVELVLYHTANLHGCLWPKYKTARGYGSGGLLRLAACYRNIKDPTTPSLLLDCGDTFQGSANCSLFRGSLTARMFDVLGYDVFLPGSHDFDHGWENLGLLLRQTSFIPVAANLKLLGIHDVPAPGIRPYILKKLAGLKVLVTGLTDPQIPLTHRPYLFQPLEITDPFIALGEVMPDIRAENPDIVILMLRRGFDQADRHAFLRKIAYAFPEIDVVIGGSPHQPVSSLTIGSLLYTQTGAFGRNLGAIRLKFDTVSRAMLSKKAVLYDVGYHTPFDSMLKKRFQADLLAVEKYLDKTIGFTSRKMPADGLNPTNSLLRNLILNAIADQTGADVVLHNAGSGYSLWPGRITERDLHALLPFDDQIGTTLLTIQDLEIILEENAQYLDTSMFMGVWGLHYDLDVSKGKQAGRIMRIKDREDNFIHANKRLKVVFNSYVLASGGGCYRALRRIVDEPIARLVCHEDTARSCLRDYLSKCADIGDLEEHGIRRLIRSHAENGE